MRCWNQQPPSRLLFNNGQKVGSNGDLRVRDISPPGTQHWQGKEKSFMTNRDEVLIE